MARPKNIERRITVNHSFDYNSYLEFEKLVGKGNVSDELRAFIKDRVEQAKKEDGSHQTTNPLNLRPVKSEVNNNKQSSLFEHFDKKDKRNEIVKFLDNRSDMNGLETLYRNCNTVVKVIDTKKRRNAVMGECQRTEGIKSNEEIIAEIKRARRWMPSI